MTIMGIRERLQRQPVPPGSSEWVSPGGTPRNQLEYGRVVTPAAPDGSTNLFPSSPFVDDGMNR